MKVISKNQTLTPALQELKLITDALMSPVTDYITVRDASISLKNLFSEAASFDDTSFPGKQDIRTDTGLAVSTRTAVHCIIDMMRTRKFILGIKDAVEKRLKMNPGKPITVFYAGAGPFATLLTPLMTVFKPEQLQMVLMEINPVTMQYLQKIIQYFRMEDYVMDAVQADAVTYSIPDHQQPDILVSETMKPGLLKEPQVSVVANLLSQCSRNPILIPEHIKVDVCLLGNMNNYPEDIFFLKPLLELDAETAVQIKNNPEKVPVLNPGIMVTIPESLPERFNSLALATTIRVFGDHILDFNESGLTIPHILMMPGSFKKLPVDLLFQYHINKEPGFRVTEV